MSSSLNERLLKTTDTEAAANSSDQKKDEKNSKNSNWNRRFGNSIRAASTTDFATFITSHKGTNDTGLLYVINEYCKDLPYDSTDDKATKVKNALADMDIATSIVNLLYKSREEKIREERKKIIKIKLHGRLIVLFRLLYVYSRLNKNDGSVLLKSLEEEHKLSDKIRETNLNESFDLYSRLKRKLKEANEIKGSMKNQVGTAGGLAAAQTQFPTDIKSNESSKVVKTTKGEGDCGFHAALGEWNENNQQYECKNIAQERAKLAKAIKECKAGNEIYKLVVAGVEALVMGGDRNVGEHIQKLRVAYQEHVQSQGEALDLVWGEFEKSLNLYPEIVKHINTSVATEEKRNPNPKRKLSTLRDQFNFCLNIKENKVGEMLDALIQSTPELSAAFQLYNQLAKNGFNLNTRIDANIIQDYAKFIAKLGQWLLPQELDLIARVNGITIHLYTPDAKKGSFSLLNAYNPGASRVVEVRFNGRDHYEKVVPNKLTRIAVDEKENPNSVVPSLIDAKTAKPKHVPSDYSHGSSWNQIKSPSISNGARPIVNAIDTISELLKTYDKAEELFDGKDNENIDKDVNDYLNGNKELDLEPAGRWREITEFRKELRNCLDPEQIPDSAWETVWNRVAVNLAAFPSSINFNSLNEVLKLAINKASQYEIEKSRKKPNVDKSTQDRRALAQEFLNGLKQKLQNIQNADQLHDTLEPLISDERFLDLAENIEKPNEDILGTSLSELLKIHKEISLKIGKPVILKEGAKFAWGKVFAALIKLKSIYEPISGKYIPSTENNKLIEKIEEDAIPYLNQLTAEQINEWRGAMVGRIKPPSPTSLNEINGLRDEKQREVKSPPSRLSSASFSQQSDIAPELMTTGILHMARYSPKILDLLRQKNGISLDVTDGFNQTLLDLLGNATRNRNLAKQSLEALLKFERSNSLRFETSAGSVFRQYLGFGKYELAETLLFSDAFKNKSAKAYLTAKKDLEFLQAKEEKCKGMIGALSPRNPEDLNPYLEKSEEYLSLIRMHTKLNKEDEKINQLTLVNHLLERTTHLAKEVRRLDSEYLKIKSTLNNNTLSPIQEGKIVTRKESIEKDYTSKYQRLQMDLRKIAANLKYFPEDHSTHTPFNELKKILPEDLSNDLVSEAKQHPRPSLPAKKDVPTTLVAKKVVAFHLNSYRQTVHLKEFLAAKIKTPENLSSDEIKEVKSMHENLAETVRQQRTFLRILSRNNLINSRQEQKVGNQQVLNKQYEDIVGTMSQLVQKAKQHSPAYRAQSATNLTNIAKEFKNLSSNYEKTVAEIGRIELLKAMIICGLKGKVLSKSASQLQNRQSGAADSKINASSPAVPFLTKCLRMWRNPTVQIITEKAKKLGYSIKI